MSNKNNKKSNRNIYFASAKTLASIEKIKLRTISEPRFSQNWD